MSHGVKNYDALGSSYQAQSVQAKVKKKEKKNASGLPFRIVDILFPLESLSPL